MEHLTEEELCKVTNQNHLLLQIEGFTKFIEGFNKGLQASSSVPTGVNDCIGETMEFMVDLRTTITALLLECEGVFKQNEQMQEKLNTCYNRIEELENENSELELEIAKIQAERGE